MRGIATTAIVVVLGVQTGVVSAAAKTSPARMCHLAKGEVVVARYTVGVVSDRTEPDPTRSRYTQETETDWWACLNGVGRRWFLGRTTAQPDGGNVGRYGGFSMEGRYVTFEGRWDSRYGLAASEIEQYNLRTGHRTISVKYEWGDEIVAEPIGSGVSSLVVNRSGDAAWLLAVPRLEGLGSVEVIVHDRTGTRTLVSYPVQLVNGAWASPITDLVITQAKISWRHDSEEQDATA